MSESKREDKQESRTQQRLESLVFWVSLVIVLGVAAALIVLDRSGGPPGPAIAGRVLGTRMVGASLEVRYEVTNKGNRSVEDVTLTIAIGEEEVTQTMTHLPLGLTREGVALFERAPRDAKASVKVQGYLEP
jgi:uncharacterized protein (TIGR02588 family)